MGDQLSIVIPRNGNQAPFPPTGWVAGTTRPAVSKVLVLGIEVSTGDVVFGDQNSSVTGSGLYDPIGTAASALTAAFAAPTFGVLGTAGSVRLPFGATPSISGPAAVASGSTNVVGFALDPKLVGNFTGIGGSDPGFAWGLDLFATVGDGTSANDVAGLTNIVGAELELDILNTTGTIAVARGGMAGVFLFGAAAGATLTVAEGFRVSAPARVSGATGGTVVNAYGLFIEAVSIGTTANFSLFVDVGGTSRLGGDVQVAQNVIGYGGILNLEAGFTGVTSLLLNDTATGGSMTAKLGWSGGNYSFQNSGGNNQFSTNAGGSFLVGYQALATTVTDGFLYIPTTAGAPTGTPTAVTGLAPIVFDTTNHKIWFYNGGWKGVVVA